MIKGKKYIYKLIAYSIQQCLKNYYNQVGLIYKMLKLVLHALM